jgi:hypothetical protein
MRQFEQDWLELGNRVARSLHYLHRRNLRLLYAAQAEARATAPPRPGPDPVGENEPMSSTGRTRPRTPEEVMPPTPSPTP